MSTKSDEADETATPVADLRELARAAHHRLAWSAASEDLHLNLLVLTGGEVVEEHVNVEVDVLVIGIAGSGIVEIEGVHHELGPGRIVVIPKGKRRSIAGRSGRLAYLSCHRRRGGLWPVRNT
jgi:quercetin dioxygenase-like cupin family protein